MAVLLLLRGGCFVRTTLSKASIAHLLRKVAFAETAMIDSLMSLDNIDIATFSPPLPAGWDPMPCEFIIHLETFQKALFAIMDDGATNAGEPATGRRQQLQAEIKRTVSRARNYLSLHSAEITGHDAEVKKRLITDVNTGLNEYLGNLAELGRTLRLEHDISPPTADDVQPASVPAFPPLRTLTAERSSSAIIGNIDNSIAGLQPHRKAPASARLANNRHPARG